LNSKTTSFSILSVSTGRTLPKSKISVRARLVHQNYSHYIVRLVLWLCHDCSSFIGYRVLSGLLIRVDLVNNWCAVDIRRTRLSGALGLGPFRSLIPYMLGEADSVASDEEKIKVSTLITFQAFTIFFKPTPRLLCHRNISGSNKNLPSRENCQNRPFQAAVFRRTHVLASRTPKVCGANAAAEARRVTRKRMALIIVT
jgi:hypothetical protein